MDGTTFSKVKKAAWKQHNSWQSSRAEVHNHPGNSWHRLPAALYRSLSHELQTSYWLPVSTHNTHTQTETHANTRTGEAQLHKHPYALKWVPMRHVSGSLCPAACLSDTHPRLQLCLREGKTRWLLVIESKLSSCTLMERILKLIYTYMCVYAEICCTHKYLEASCRHFEQQRQLVLISWCLNKFVIYASFSFFPDVCIHYFGWLCMYIQCVYLCVCVCVHIYVCISTIRNKMQWVDH